MYSSSLKMIRANAMAYMGSMLMLMLTVNGLSVFITSILTTKAKLVHIKPKIKSHIQSIPTGMENDDDWNKLYMVIPIAPPTIS